MNVKNDKKLPATWIIGYGNPYRRDDGLGPFVAEALGGILKNRKDIGVLILEQLDPSLVETLKDADDVIFIDAAIETLSDDIVWQEVAANTEFTSFVTHFWQPESVLGLLQLMFSQRPSAKTIGIKGETFDFGHGLSVNARKRAHMAILKVLGYLGSEALDAESGRLVQ